jgi:ribosome-associated toxin RatA of RatAB toxin-antitoxin module
MEVRRLLLVPHPAERMYDLIEGAEYYPSFLPWCGAATVLARNDEEVAARVTVEVRGVRFQFVTRNRKRRPTWMGLGLEEGPFRRFDGEWNLAPLGDAGCRIDFVLRYDFENAVMRRVAGAVFERITSTLVEAFVARADALGERIPRPAPVPAIAPAVAPASTPAAAPAPSLPGAPASPAGTAGAPAAAPAGAPVDSPSPDAPRDPPASRGTDSPDEPGATT